MKKVALLFVAAALFVACAEEPKKEPGITQEQKDSIYNALKEPYLAKAKAVVPEFVPNKNGFIDSAACIARAEKIKAAILATGDTTNRYFKNQFNAAVKKLDDRLKAEAAAERKAKEEAEQKVKGK